MEELHQKFEDEMATSLSMLHKMPDANGSKPRYLTPTANVSEEDAE